MYGFNLGQIEGLDSSVKTVTLTIANATESNTYTLKYDDNAGSWTDDIDNGSMWLYYIDADVFGLEITNFTESDVGDTYNVTVSTSAVEENLKSAVETVLVDNGLISEPETIFDETLTLTNEELQYELTSDFPDGWYENAVCAVNGMEIHKDPETEYAFHLLTEAVSVILYYVPSEGEYPAVLNFSYCDVPNDYAIIPGDYQVKIVAQAGSGGGGSSGLPDVSASDNGSVMGVINGEWGVDDRLNAYPSIDNLGSGTYGFRQGRNNIIPSQIVPIPITAAEAYYDIGAFYLPFSGSEEKTPHYKKATTNPPIIPTYYNICFLTADSDGSNEPSFAIQNTVISKGNSDGVYTLKATVSNGTISLAWVRDT